MSNWFSDLLGGANGLIDDVVNFGAGALESVGEGLGSVGEYFPNLVDGSNPNSTQQPNHPQVDNNGNTITQPQGGSGTATQDNTTLYVLGGVALLVIVLVLLMNRKG